MIFFGFLDDECKMINVFIFSNLMMAENIKVVYGVGKVFLMIKMDWGSWFHKCTLSLIKW